MLQLRRFCSSRPAASGIFVDAENLTQFLKANGAQKLVESAAEFGSPLVRHAYGNWNVPAMQGIQQGLLANGFQMIHTPYPVAKKSAADIAMVVDVMATQQRTNACPN